VQALVFPALHIARAGEVPAAVQGEAEASCYYHPQSRAAEVCSDCGRFLCHLCALELDGRHVCPRCFEKTEVLIPNRTMYDTMALAMVLFPPLLFWPAIVGAPWALVLVFTRWNAPASLVPRTKIRFIIAAILALAEIGFGVFIIYMILQVSLKGPKK